MSDTRHCVEMGGHSCTALFDLPVRQAHDELIGQMTG
jgi:hypothetical protein